MVGTFVFQMLVCVSVLVLSGNIFCFDFCTSDGRICDMKEKPCCNLLFICTKLPYKMFNSCERDTNCVKDGMNCRPHGHVCCNESSQCYLDGHRYRCQSSSGCILDDEECTSNSRCCSPLSSCYDKVCQFNSIDYN